MPVFDRFTMLEFCAFVELRWGDILQITQYPTVQLRTTINAPYAHLHHPFAVGYGTSVIGAPIRRSGARKKD